MVRLLEILHLRALILGLLTILIAAFGAVAQDQASASIYDAQGNLIAQALLFQLGDVVQVDIKNYALPVGTYGVHVHEVGMCEGPDFTSAGGHFNPHGKEHGIANPNGPHAGDLPNLDVIEDGTGYIEWPLTELSLVMGEPDTIFDADGSSVIIHGGADDNMTDPSGNSGPRLGCGVIKSGVFDNPNEERVPDPPVTPNSTSANTENPGIAIYVLPLLALLVLVAIIMRAVG